MTENAYIKSKCCQIQTKKRNSVKGCVAIEIYQATVTQLLTNGNASLLLIVYAIVIWRNLVMLTH